jgi:hypothetical protein
MEKKVLLLGLLLCCGTAFPEQQSINDSKAIPFNGLTGTITALLGSKPKARIQLGSYSISPDEIVEKSINQIFDCDNPVNKYLTENDECYYGQLAEIIKEKINDNVMDKTARVYIIVDASEDSNIATISIAVNYSKNAILPVYVDSINSELKVSLAIPCTIEYSASLTIEVDSDRVNNDENLKGISIGVDNYEISIKSYEDDWNYAATMVYNDILYELPLQEHSINAYFDWMLLDNKGYDEERPRITYEQLSKGDYRWESESISNISFSGKANNNIMDEDETLEVSITLDNTISIEDQKIEVTDEEGTREFAINQLGF